MVFKRSEYGLQYKKSHLVKNIPEYYNHVAYRTHRRELEHAHTPLSWDFESETQTTSDEDVSDLPLQKLTIKEEECDNEQKNHGNDPESDHQDNLIQQAKDKLKNYDSKDNQNTDEDKKYVKTVEDDLKLKGDKKDDVQSKGGKKDGVPSKGDKDYAQSKGDKKDAVQSKGADKECCGKNDLVLDLKDNQDKNKGRKLRPKTAPIYRPPFMAYGCGDRERETGVKRSFNVRASADVYPAAMKALVDLHQKQKRRETARRCLSARERKRKALVQEKAAKEVAGWQSEYRRMYPQYKTDEYARCAARIQDKPHVFKPYKF